MDILVVPPNPIWQDEFAVEAKQICTALGDTLVAIYHIGSTGNPWNFREANHQHSLRRQRPAGNMISEQKE